MTWKPGWSLLIFIHLVICEYHQSHVFRILTEDFRYTSALQSLSHALLLSPQNPFTVLQFAETAFSAGDVPLALKMFLVVIDMDDESAALEPPRGFSIRAWFGIKLVCKT